MESTGKRLGLPRGIRKVILNEECQKVQRAAIQAERADRGCRAENELEIAVHESPLPASNRPP